MKALVIEDDDNLRRTLIRLVSRAFFDDIEVLGAVRMEDAICLLRESEFSGPFDLIVSDYNLASAGTGGDVLEWIRLRMPQYKDRFVFLSSDEAQIARYGVPYFVKPYDVSQFKNSLYAIVDGANRL